MANVKKLPVTIIRGGTSKGVYILEEDLPADKAEWEPLLLRLMGSPDKKQIDGLGGSQSVTSKVAIVKKSDHPGAGADYTVEFSSNRKIGTATVKVTGTGGYTGTASAGFSINPKKVAGLSLKAGRRALTAAWKKAVVKLSADSKNIELFEGMV